MFSNVSKAAIPLVLTFSLFGQPASANSPAVDSCIDRNDVAVNFIVTRALMPRGANQPDVYGDETLANMPFPITIQSGGAYAQFRTDGKQGDTTRAQLTSLCLANPDMDLPRELMAEIVNWLNPPESLIEIETRKAVESRELRHKYRQGGAAHIPNYIDKPKAP